jgi:hypothetical protein
LTLTSPVSTTATLTLRFTLFLLPLLPPSRTLPIHSSRFAANAEPPRRNVSRATVAPDGQPRAAALVIVDDLVRGLAQGGQRQVCARALVE